MRVADLQPIIGEKNPIVERLDLERITTLEVDVGWRTAEQAVQFIETVKGQFDELGYGHLALRPVHKLRRGMILLDGIVYKVDTKRAAQSDALRFMQNLKSRLEVITDWCRSNCAGKFVLDSRGLVFEDDDDYLLFMLKWK